MVAIFEIDTSPTDAVAARKAFPERIGIYYKNRLIGWALVIKTRVVASGNLSVAIETPEDTELAEHLLAGEYFTLAPGRRG